MNKLLRRSAIIEDPFVCSSHDEEKRSLTGASVPESETDSMNDYADGETGKFTEDGSFIGTLYMN